jgi:hypothetical protein
MVSTKEPWLLDEGANQEVAEIAGLPGQAGKINIRLANVARMKKLRGKL